MTKKRLIFAVTLMLIFFQGSAGFLVLAKSDNVYTTDIQLPDVLVLDRQGNEQKLSALFRDRTIIANFIFTSCSSICPALSVTMKAIEDRVKNRLGKEVILVSISVDPINDTPEKMRAYSEKFEASPHWYWLTGRKSDINQVLKAFGIPTDGQPEDHPPVIILGNAQTGKWLRWVGIPAPDALIDAVDAVSSGQALSL